MDRIDRRDGDRHIFARLYVKSQVYLMTKERVVVGRNSSKGSVDVDMGVSNFISRNHLELFHSQNRIFLLCNGKNGVFVNNEFRAHSKDPYLLPENCNMRFPSTNLKIFLESCKDEELHVHRQSQNQMLNPSLSTSGGGSLDGGLSPLHDYDCKPGLGSSESGKNAADRSVIAGGNGSGGASAAAAAAAAASAAAAGMPDDLLLPIRLPVPHDADDFPPVPASNEKPAFSYAQLIVQAIMSTQEQQMTLSSIYNFISRHYPYYKPFEKGWQNSIRHNLSLNRYFIRVPRSHDEPGKGAFWTIDSAYKQKLAAGAYRQRRSRGVAVYRSDPVLIKAVQRYSPDTGELDSLSNYIQHAQQIKANLSRDASPEPPSSTQQLLHLHHQPHQMSHDSSNLAGSSSSSSSQQQQQQQGHHAPPSGSGGSTASALAGAASSRVQLPTGGIVHTPRHQSASSNLIQWRRSIAAARTPNASLTGAASSTTAAVGDSYDDGPPPPKLAREFVVVNSSAADRGDSAAEAEEDDDGLADVDPETEPDDDAGDNE